MSKKFEYKTAMRLLRGKVNFNYDLRKSLSSGQKASIRKAFNQATEYGITNKKAKARFIKPPKKRNESQTHYKRRVERIKENTGQQGSPFVGIYVDSPVELKDVHYSFKGDKLLITRPKFGYVELWVSIDPVRLVQGGYDYLKPIVDNMREQGFQRMNLVSAGAYRSGASYILDSSDDFLEGQIDYLLNQYQTQGDVTQWLTGFVFSKNVN